MGRNLRLFTVPARFQVNIGWGPEVRLALVVTVPCSDPRRPLMFGRTGSVFFYRLRDRSSFEQSRPYFPRPPNTIVWTGGKRQRNGICSLYVTGCALLVGSCWFGIATHPYTISWGRSAFRFLHKCTTSDGMRECARSLTLPLGRFTRRIIERSHMSVFVIVL